MSSQSKNDFVDQEKLNSKLHVTPGESTPKDVAHAFRKIKNEHGQVVSIEDAPGSDTGTPTNGVINGTATTTNGKVSIF